MNKDSIHGAGQKAHLFSSFASLPGCPPWLPAVEEQLSVRLQVSAGQVLIQLAGGERMAGNSLGSTQPVVYNHHPVGSPGQGE